MAKNSRWSPTPATEHRAVLLFGAPGSQGCRGNVSARSRTFYTSPPAKCSARWTATLPGREVRADFERGELVPDELTIRIFRDAVERLAASGRFRPQEDTLILDGIPRNVNQCRILENEIDVVRVVHLVSSDPEVMVARIKQRAEREGRPDDADETIIRHRFDVYRRETEPVLCFYPSDLILEIDALGHAGRSHRRH